jgi:GT2 family glycosyltransferase
MKYLPGTEWRIFDYCYRARKAGFKIGVAKDIAVKHGVNGYSYGSTFIPVRGEKQMADDDRENRRRFAEKWGIENDAAKIMEFIDAA